MEKTKFSNGPISGILKEPDPGKKVNGICREHGIIQLTFYSWQSKYSGMEIHQLKL